MTDTVTGLRELPGYPPLTGARRDWPWKAGIQTGAHPPGAFQDYALRTRSTEIPQARAGGRRLLPFRNLDPS